MAGGHGSSVYEEEAWGEGVVRHGKHAGEVFLGVALRLLVGELCELYGSTRAREGPGWVGHSWWHRRRCSLL